ncbi:MAG TPA: NADH-quinone oxidoreductase subunit N [Gemmataceae bacterium]|jgi:NADH-quinone oxidoreductase subunit N|nr:NADH-quinone oxidoreductase subunit N [Gemmataceae bacterium]
MITPLAAFGWKDPDTLKGVFTLAAPEAFLLAMACVIYLGGTFRQSRQLWGSVSLLALALAGVIYGLAGPFSHGKSTDSPLLADSLSLYVKVIAWIGGAAFILLSWQELKDEGAAEFHACLLILLAGLSLVGSANELITLFLSLELISIPTYILLYLPRSGVQAQEATIKYFLLSVFSSGLLLFGFSYLYGISGSTNLSDLFGTHSEVKSESLPGLFLMGFVLVIAGLGFRLTAVPFHFYAPDVFQGAPTSMAALLAFIPKVAGFAALIRILGYFHLETANAVRESQVSMLFLLLSIITMSVGNVLALLQDNLKRILAYSSIAHAGYMLIGFAAAPELVRNRLEGTGALNGTDAVLFYLVAYGAMTVGAFAIISYLGNGLRPVETVDDVAGLGRSHPGLALTFALFLFSLIGLPLTAGFSGKLLLFFSALGVTNTPGSEPLETRQLFVALAVVAAINSAISAYYYLRIVAVMFLREPLSPLKPKWQIPALATVAICAIVTIVFGVYPAPLAKAARQAATPPGAPPVQASR